MYSRIVGTIVLVIAVFITTVHNTGGQSEDPPKEEPIVRPKPAPPPEKKQIPPKELPPVKLPTDVPIISGKKQPVNETQSVLPINFVKNRIENIKVSTAAYVGFDAIRVDSKRKCWLDPHALTGNKSNDKPIQVKRDATGFHIVLEDVDYQWEAVDIETKNPWLPVITISNR